MVNIQIYINRKSKEAIGKPFFMKEKLIQSTNNFNDVRHHLKRLRGAGTVSPPKKNLKYRYSNPGQKKKISKNNQKN